MQRAMRIGMPSMGKLQGNSAIVKATRLPIQATKATVRSMFATAFRIYLITTITVVDFK
jgi:hypothetical protein